MINTWHFLPLNSGLVKGCSYLVWLLLGRLSVAELSVRVKLECCGVWVDMTGWLVLWRNMNHYSGLWPDWACLPHCCNEISSSSVFTLSPHTTPHLTLRSQALQGCIFLVYKGTNRGRNGTVKGCLKIFSSFRENYQDQIQTKALSL